MNLLDIAACLKCVSTYVPCAALETGRHCTQASTTRARLQQLPRPPTLAALQQLQPPALAAALQPPPSDAEPPVAQVHVCRAAAKLHFFGQEDVSVSSSG